MEQASYVQQYIRFETDTDDEMADLHIELYEEAMNRFDFFVSRTGIDPTIFKRKILLIAILELIKTQDMPDRLNEANEAMQYIAGNLKIGLNSLEITYLGMVLLMIEGTLSDVKEISDKNLEGEEKYKIYKSIFKSMATACTLFGQVVGSLNERDFLEKSGAFIHKKGAKARSRKFNQKKREAFRRFNEGGYSSFASCADDIHKQLGISSDTVKRWLSEMQKQHRQPPPKPQ